MSCKICFRTKICYKTLCETSHRCCRQIMFCGQGEFKQCYFQTIYITIDKQNALRRECTFKIEILLEIGVAGVNIDLKITILTLSDVLARLAQAVRPWRMAIDFYQ